ncbi:MAG: hypothetical protein ACFFDH_04515 [Promethearchaeota archaeon]
MKVKKINYFGKKTIKKFVIQLNFTKDFELFDILKIADFTNSIVEEFPDVPKILLMPKPGETINLGPLIYKDTPKGNNSFEIGRNFVKFNFSRYERWVIEIERIKKVLTKLNNFLILPTVKDINMTYIDEFQLKIEDFDFGKYFTFPIDPEKKWKYFYDDFFLGFVPYQEYKGEEKIKLVFRLRSIAQTEIDYIYSLETAYLTRNSMIEVDDSLYSIHLERAHDFIITYFIDFLTPNYQRELQLDFTEVELDY